MSRPVQLKEREYRASEARFLWGTDTPDSIARRLGYKDAACFARRLHIWGEHELANRFERDARCEEAVAA